MITAGVTPSAAESIAFEHDRKWALVWISLVLPGSGLLAARRWEGLLWLAAFAASACIPSASSTPLLVLLALGSAERARRAAQPRPPWQPTGGIAHRTWYRAPRGRSVSLGFELDVPLGVEQAWSRVADLEHFLCLDPFHCRVTRNTRGLVIEHAVMGLRLLRYGRILWWVDGEGYALSDLSGAGRRRGFPHVFFVRVQSLDPMHTRVTVDVRGKWTLPGVPAALGMLWLRWVVHDHARILHESL